MSGRSFSQLDHTADLALEIRAESEAGLLEEGARAVTSVLTESATIREVSQRRVRVDSLDREDRLVQWLNEVLVLALTEGFVTARAQVTLTDDGLDAFVYGEPDAADRIVTELKSVTYHGIIVEPESEGWIARVVIDV